MALAGVGNPVGGSNPIGTGTSLNYLGNHCWGASGIIQPSTGAVTGLDFTTANNSYIVSKLTICVDAGDLASGVEVDFLVKFNGETVIFSRREASSTDILDAPLPSRVDLIIPGNTRVEIIGQTNGGALDMTFFLVGRVYA